MKIWEEWKEKYENAVEELETERCRSRAFDKANQEEFRAHVETKAHVARLQEEISKMDGMMLRGRVLAKAARRIENGTPNLLQELADLFLHSEAYYKEEEAFNNWKRGDDNPKD